MTAKNQLRREIARQRCALDSRWIASASARISDRLQRLDEFQHADTIALYMAIDGEVDLNALPARCQALGKTTCIPFYSNSSECYEMAEINPNTRFKMGQFGIPEPENPALIGRDKIDLMIVPGVAFDLSGNRLGRGGGYYDRLLRNFKGTSLAVAFDFQIRSRIPFDLNDIPVDLIVTETKTVKVQNEH